MKGAGETGEVAAIGDLEAGQKGKLLPEDLSPEEENRKREKATDGYHAGSLLM